MPRLTHQWGRGGMRFLWSLALLWVCSGCPHSSSPFEEKVPSRWIRIKPTVESQAGAILSSVDLERLKATVPMITKLVAERHATVAVACDGRTREIDLCATSPDMLKLLSDVAGTTVSEGRFLATEDSQQEQSVIVLTQPIAEALFAGTSPIGKEVTIGGKEFVVVGIVMAGDQLAIRHAGHDAYVPMTSTAVATANAASPAADAEVDCIWVSVRTLDDVSATREVIAATLEKYHGGGAFSVK